MVGSGGDITGLLAVFSKLSRHGSMGSNRIIVYINLDRITTLLPSNCVISVFTKYSCDHGWIRVQSRYS